MCVQLFSCRGAGVWEGSPSLLAAGAEVRPESARLPKLGTNLCSLRKPGAQPLGHTVSHTKWLNFFHLVSRKC